MRRCCFIDLGAAFTLSNSLFFFFFPPFIQIDLIQIQIQTQTSLISFFSLLFLSGFPTIHINPYQSIALKSFTRILVIPIFNQSHLSVR